MNGQIVKGSLSAIATEQNMPLAETWLSVDAVILVDVSGSMSQRDGREKTRLELAREALGNLQGNMQGKIAMFTFSDDVKFIPNGYIAGVEGTTNLTSALRYVHMADAIPQMKFILISDGEPDWPNDAMREARKFKNKIDVIYIGRENGSGQKFLESLAAATGGKSKTIDAAMIEDTTARLLLEAQ
jgi:Mg-chelatase subunit ChlD